MSKTPDYCEECRREAERTGEELRRLTWGGRGRCARCGRILPNRWGRLTSWEEDHDVMGTIGSGIARVIGAAVAGVGTFYIQQVWGFSEPVALVLAVIAAVFVLFVSGRVGPFDYT